MHLNDDDRILVIGSGGIGCELLKLLYSTNKSNITLIDYDIIELTNLNRQFLFTDEDIKKYKCTVAAEKYKKMLPSAQIEAIPKNIFEFDINFFSQFKVVFNCLDNNKARKYVNERCLITKVPLIDGGSTGFLGQSFFFDYKNECFHCIPEKVEKEIPICTIRTFPTEFNHCLIWAKEYFFEKIKEESINELLKEEMKNTEENELRMQKIKEYFYVLKERNEFSFDKDDPVSMGLIYYASLIRADFFGLESKSYFESQSVIGKIIPSVCTTNSIVASFMLLSCALEANFYIFDRKKFLKIEPNVKNEECSFCKNRIFVLKHKNMKLKELFILIKEVVSGIESVFDNEKVVYHKYMCRNVNKALEIGHNSFFYVKGNEVICIYNFLWEKEESSFEEIKY